MQRFFRLWLLAGLVSCLWATELSREEVAKLAEQAREAWDVPGVAVAIVKEGRVLYQGAHGVKEAGKPDPLTVHSTFHIASTTKAFTSTAVAMMVDAGKMAWDDPVRKHLDYFRLADPHADALVTLRDLLSHRTGLPRHDVLWVRTGFDRENLLRRMAYAKPSEPFRSKYQYQNLMFTAAGEAAGKASGLGWDALVREQIFAPLGMADSATTYADALRHTDRAMPHIRKLNQNVAVPWTNYDNIGGAGSIASSIADMTAWLRLQVNGGELDGKRLVSEKNLRETQLPNMFNRLTEAQQDLQPDFTQTTYGLGWSINHYRGEMLVMHAGVLQGFRALVTMVPRTRLGMVILANRNGTNLPEALTNTLLDGFLDLAKTRDWNAHMLAATKRTEAKQAEAKAKREAERQRNTKPSLDLAKYAGRYWEPAYGEAIVSFAKGKLSLEWARFQGELTHWHYDRFEAKGEGALAGAAVQFHLDDAGKAGELTLFEQRFVRKKH
ncbi:MAG: serine hydrolase [Bryobacter sp.]|nr:serine hydrolase [Bryobacter sp.]